MSTFRPPVGPIQPSIFFTPGQPPSPPSPSFQQQAACFRQTLDFAPLDEVLPPYYLPPAQQISVAPSQMIDASRRQEIAALDEVLPPFVIPPTLSSFRPPANLQLEIRGRPWDYAAQDAVSFTYTIGQPLGKPSAPALQIPAQSARSELAALDEVLPPFVIQIAPTAVVPPAAAQSPASAARADLAALDEVLPPYYLPPAQQIPAGGVATPLPAIARNDALLIEETLPYFTSGLSRPPALPVGSILTVRQDLTSTNFVLAKVRVAASPAFVPATRAAIVAGSPVTDRSIFQRFTWTLIVVPITEPPADRVLEALYRSRALIAPYHSRTIIVTYNSRTLEV